MSYFSIWATKILKISPTQAKFSLDAQKRKKERKKTRINFVQLNHIESKENQDSTDSKIQIEIFTTEVKPEVFT